MRRGSGVGVRVAIVLAVLAAMATLGAAVTSSASPRSSASALVGNDISWPQCGTTYPSDQAFGIVGVNDGVPDTLNPCLGSSSNYSKSELYWAVSTSTGTSAQPKASLYVNTSDPGDVFDGTPVSDWPTSGSTPYGACTTTTVTTNSGRVTAGENSPACAWQYGDEAAAEAASLLRAAAAAIDAQSPPVSVPAAPDGYPWWLDVETGNSWQQGSAGQAMNVAVLQGIVVGLRAAGAPSVGVYSTAYQWTEITGGTSSSTTTLGGLPTWMPGASDETGAKTICKGDSFTAGTVTLAQFPSAQFDGDLSCAGPTTVTHPAVPRVYGATADATAAAELTRAFPYTKGTCPSSRAVVLATTKTYQDALSSQFLAQSLTTGTLLTPTTSLSAVTAATLRDEGITTVYVVGGPLAITTTVTKAVGVLTAYECGGTTRGTTTGKIMVQRLDGQTQYGTAEAVAEHVGAAASKAFPGAYATTNATGGTGRYNDTKAEGSSAPTGSVATAILASGEEFQDAQAASVVSYRTRLPLLLTPATTLSTTAVAAITQLGIKQVVLMGGTLAVSNTVEAELVAKTGVSVLRVAGTAYTDTAVELARFEAAGATAGLSWSPGHKAMVARGNGFTDGLAGAVLDDPLATATGSAGTARPLLLTESPTVLGTPLVSFLKTTGHTGIAKTKAKTITSLVVLGGPLAVSTTAATQMETDLTH